MEGGRKVWSRREKAGTGTLEVVFWGAEVGSREAGNQVRWTVGHRSSEAMPWAPLECSGLSGGIGYTIVMVL